MLAEDEVQRLLDDLCVRLGFCLPPDAQINLRRRPPESVSAFAEAVIRAEGLEPNQLPRELRRTIAGLIEDAFQRSAAVDGSSESD